MMTKRVTLKRLDGTEVSFDARVDEHGLTPERKARLERLFAWCEAEDAKYAERKARGEIGPRKVEKPAETETPKKTRRERKPCLTLAM